MAGLSVARPAQTLSRVKVSREATDSIRRSRVGSHRPGRGAACVRHARRNSELVAVVSGDRTKRREMAKRYRLDGTFTYDEFDECLKVVDAVYIALPNSMHAEYTVRAARAGVHVLCEKPMAVTVDECRQMITACRKADTKLMIAYRLHFETLNLSAIELAKRGDLGDLKYLNSSFSMMVRQGDIRTKKAYGGGTLYDIGVYCINAARNLFRAEPTQCRPCRSTAGSPRWRRSTRRRQPRFGLGMNVWRRSYNFHAADVAHTGSSVRRATCTRILRTNPQKVLNTR